MSINELIEQLKTWDPEAQLSIMTGHFAREYFPLRVENVHGHPVIIASDEQIED